MDFLLQFLPFGDAISSVVSGITFYKLVANYGGLLMMLVSGLGFFVMAWKHRTPSNRSAYRFAFTSIRDIGMVLFLLMLLGMGFFVFLVTSGFIKSG